MARSGVTPARRPKAVDTPARRTRRRRASTSRAASPQPSRAPELCRDLTREKVSVCLRTSLQTERRSCMFELEALGSDKPTLRVLDAGGMARPGVTTRRDETPAASVSGSGFGIGLVSDAASSPDPEAVFVVCHELLGRLNRRAPRQTLLYVDVNGVALVDAKTARCVSRAAFNELTSWCAVDARVFELKQLGVETRKLESRRFEMPKAGVAAELDAAMRSRVRLYVERPDEVRRLRATAAAFRTGDRVRREALARAHGLGGGGGETAIRGEAVASASRDENVPFATFGRKESADWEALRVASATPGERLARAGARRAARGRDHTQLQEGTRDASATESKPGDSPGEKNGKGAFGTFADGAGLDDASLRAAYARREAAYAKLREEEDDAWEARGFRRQGSQSESESESDAFSFSVETEGRRLPAEPPSDAPGGRGFRARERGTRALRARPTEAPREVSDPRFLPKTKTRRSRSRSRSGSLVFESLSPPTRRPPPRAASRTPPPSARTPRATTRRPNRRRPRTSQTRLSRFFPPASPPVCSPSRTRLEFLPGVGCGRARAPRVSRRRARGARRESPTRREALPSRRFLFVQTSRRVRFRPARLTRRLRRESPSRRLRLRARARARAPRGALCPRCGTPPRWRVDA